jgi:nucleoside-diphosphate-sugar epimerase
METLGKLAGRDVPFTRRSLKFFKGNTAFSSQKAFDLLDYEAKIDLAEGLQNTYKWLSEASLI